MMKVTTAIHPRGDESGEYIIGTLWIWNTGTANDADETRYRWKIGDRPKDGDDFSGEVFHFRNDGAYTLINKVTSSIAKLTTWVIPERFETERT